MKHRVSEKQKGLGLLMVLSGAIALMSLMFSSVDLLSDVSDPIGQGMTWLTYSAGSQGFLVTLALLVGLALWVIRSASSRYSISHRSFLTTGHSSVSPRPSVSPRRQLGVSLIGKAVQLALLLVFAFVAKSGLKLATESPRPYTELLSHQLLIPQPAHFYKLDAEQKDQVIDALDTRVSDWRTRHWHGEKDYSFPSGHTLFVAVCVAFFGGLYAERKHYGLAAGVLIWALAVAYSRLWLGMHRPIDLVGSVAVAALIYTLVPRLTVPLRWQEKLTLGHVKR